MGETPHVRFGSKGLGGVEAAATVGRPERRAPQSALTEKLTMRQAAQLAAKVAPDRLLMIPALLHSRPSHSNVALSAFS
jgi:hypothetical protein